jgi:uncharacterized protein (DUF2235 family)
MSIPTRLVICVDGEQPSGAGKNKPVLTNLQRINASVTRGNCTSSSTGLTYNQHVLYLPGVGNADDAFSKDRLLGGQVYLKQIQEVYESCSRLNGSRDEVWLFGFSRGAYVVRAVAGLLHAFGAIASAGEPEFGRDFKRLLKDADKGGSTLSLALGPVCTVLFGVQQESDYHADYHTFFHDLCKHKACSSDTVPGCIRHNQG